MTTPILIQHGDRDPRVPISNAQKFSRALEGMGEIVEYDLYPGGGMSTTNGGSSRNRCAGRWSGSAGFRRRGDGGQSL